MKIFITLFVVLALGVNFAYKLDESALAIQDENFNRAMVSFGLAKGLNGIISLIQGTELSITPMGMGINFSVGEVLDPFNDMVERFSWVMLGASVSLGVQTLLLNLSAKLFLQVMFALSAIVTLALLWVKRFEKSQFFIYALKFFALFFILRFGAIVFIYTSQLLYVTSLEKEYDQASIVVLETKNELQELQQNNKKLLDEQKEESFLSGFTQRYSKIKASLDISKQLANLEESIDKASRNIITIITLFLVQTVFFPLLYLWFTYLSLKAIFRIEFKTDTINLLYNH